MAVVALLKSEVLHSIVYAFDPQVRTIAAIVSLLAAVPAIDVLDVCYLAILDEGYSLIILSNALQPCWYLVVAHESQSLNQRLGEVVNPFCHVV